MNYLSTIFRRENHSRVKKKQKNKTKQNKNKKQNQDKDKISKLAETK